MAESNQINDILDFVHKTCNLFDSYIEYNNNLVLKFQNLKQYGQTIIENLAKNKIIINQSIANGVSSDSNVSLSNKETDLNDHQTQSNCLNHSISFETAASGEEDQQIELEESHPLSPSVISNTNHFPQSPMIHNFKSSLDCLIDYIQENPISDEFNTEKLSNDDENERLIKSIQKKYQLKECFVVLQRLDSLQLVNNRSTRQKSVDEDSEIDRLIDISNILNTDKPSENTNSNGASLVKQSKYTKDISNDEVTSNDLSDSFSEEENELVDQNNLEERLLSIGLVPRMSNDDKDKPTKMDEESNDDSNSGDESEPDPVPSAKIPSKKGANKDHRTKEAIRPDLAMPTLEASDDEAKNSKPKEKTSLVEEQADENGEERDNNDSKEGSERMDSSTSDQITIDNVEGDEDEDHNEIISPGKRAKSKLRISSTEDSNSLSNDTTEKEAEIKEVVESSLLNNENESSNKNDKSDEDDEIIKPKKKRKRKKKNDGSDEDEEVDDDEAANRESEKKKFRKRKRAKTQFKKEPHDGHADDEAVDQDDANSRSNNSDSSVVELNSEDEEEKEPTRHKIRNVIDDRKLTKETQEAEKAEKERIKRLKEKEQVEKSLANNLDGVYLDIDKESKKGLIKIDESLVKILKPYQLEGIRFMWNSCFESVERIKKGNEGSGCILAHCMGLGKTLQVISLVNTLLAHKEITECERVLILMPVNVLLNWKHEFSKWQQDCKYHVKVYVLPDDKHGKDKMKQRSETLERWSHKGGVFLMGYNIFSNFVSGKNVKPKKYIEKFKRFLADPGPNLIICDEGHLLKNATSNTAKSVNQVITKRRIVLTGTPLQNNLNEYHCMVSFVKPNLLGTQKEFRNRFVNPIYNGQHKDSTEADVKMMKRRAHVLHQTLEGCVNRKDFCVIREFLKPKNEYVLSIRLSEKQILLYRTYLVKQRGIENISNLGKLQGAQLFADFQLLSRIWTHPWVLKISEGRQQKTELKIAEKNFINDDEDDVEELEEVEAQIVDDDDVVEESRSDKTNSVSDEEVLNTNGPTTSRKSKYKTRSRIGVNGGGINDAEETASTTSEQSNPEASKWWSEMVTPDCEFDFELSGKLVVLKRILDICEERNDKLIVFSQSLMSLDLIEKFLVYLEQTENAKWTKNKDYFRIDGNTDVNRRKEHINSFNNLRNSRSRLFLISTRAGGIGVNLIGANRCVIFDASWNPSYDTQSIFRIYRLGQTKEVFVYRFLSQGTMEEKIYQRQVTKQSLSQRVVDEHQLDRHFTSNELRELYAFEPDTDTSEIPSMPSDDLMKRLLLDCKKWIVRYHDHESLLENKLDEGLSEEDRKAAWDEYEAELNPVKFIPMPDNNQYPFNINNFNPLTMTPQYTNIPNLNANVNLLNNQYRHTQPNGNMYNNLSNLNNNANFLPNLNNFGQPLAPNRPTNEQDLLNRIIHATNQRDLDFYRNQLRIKNPQLYQQLALNYQFISNQMQRPTNVNLQQINMRVNPASSNTPRPTVPNTNLSRPTVGNSVPPLNRLPTQLIPSNANIQTDASRPRPQNN